jgi:hypothetical protein
MELVLERDPLEACSSVYETALFSSCFLLAFFAFLRVGEFAESHLSERHMLQYSDTSIDKENGLINLSLPSSKTKRKVDFNIDET